MDRLEVKTRLFRVVTIGDASVGKTSIITQLVRGQFDSEQRSTVGAMFVPHVEMVGSRRVEMQIWDTAGQERFRSLGPIYYRNAAAAVIVFDLTCLDTFERIESWVRAFLNIAGERAIVCIVGNKADLTGEIALADEEVLEWTNLNRLQYFKTSAKTGEGIRQLFHAVAVELVKHETQLIPPEQVLGDKDKAKTECC
jgi:small GTP-binding protein